MGRLNSELRGGAWCPRSFISQETGLQEFLEVDLLQEHTITGVITQGRFANGQGQEYAEHFQLQYWRDDMEAFVDYVDNTGKVPVLPGNLNTYEAARVLLDPPVLTRKIRILPYSQHPRTVCMRVELLGCQLARKSLEVSVPAQTAASHLAVEPRLAPVWSRSTKSRGSREPDLSCVPSTPAPCLSGRAVCTTSTRPRGTLALTSATWRSPPLTQPPASAPLASHRCRTLTGAPPPAPCPPSMLTSVNYCSTLLVCK